MFIFLIDMADMFLVAYLMGILCEKVSKKKIAVALFILVICILQVLDKVWFIHSYLLGQFLIMGLFMKGKFIQRFLWCMELQLLIVVFDILLINLGIVTKNIQPNQNFQNLYIIRGLLILVFVLVFLKKRDYINEIFRKTSFLFSGYMIISIGINIVILVLVYMCLRGEYMEIGLSAFAFGTILFSILQMALCIIVQILIYLRKELKISNEMIIQQKEHYKEMDRKNAELKSFRHDFMEYVYTMNDMAAKEEIKELKNYLADLSQQKETIYYLYTGNYIADTVINRYYEMAEKEGVIFRYMGKWGGKLYGITDVEISSVLSNILKNAFEAVMRVPQGEEKKIIVEMGKERMYEYIFLENTAVGYEELNGKLVTQKEDKECHGMGMENVRKIMEKCGGILEWKYENGIFYTWVYFFAEEITS